MTIEQAGILGIPDDFIYVWLLASSMLKTFLIEDVIFTIVPVVFQIMGPLDLFLLLHVLCEFFNFIEVFESTLQFVPWMLIGIGKCNL